MKNLKIIILFFLAITVYSCQDVVDIPLNTDKPRLVIDASINWEKGTTGDLQKIKLTTTTNFYTNTIPTVSGAVITVTNSTNTVFNFIETPNTGIYLCNNFVSAIDEVYTLKIVSNGQTYTATDKLKSVATINNVTQEAQSGVIRENILKFKANYIDPANVDNYYLYKYVFPRAIRPRFNPDEDTFFQGNPFFSLAFEDELLVGDVIQVTHFGITKEYYNYMNILLSVSGSQGGGPFQSPPATVKGNIKNTTDFENYPFGYFRLCETSTFNYTVQ
jgi:hypothetical protein